MVLYEALLGFLSHGSMSGYDLKRAFDESVSHFWPADQSQIYRSLARLEADGLITTTVIEQTDRPARKVHTITDAGRQQLHDWLTGPQEPVKSREPFLVRTFFADELTRSEQLDLLSRHRAAVEEARSTLTDLDARQPANPGVPADLYLLRRATLTHGIAMAEAELAWLDSLTTALTKLDD